MPAASIEPLKRLSAGRYETLDGRYLVVKEQVEPTAYGFRFAWWIYDQEAGSNPDACNVNDPCATLWEARGWIRSER